MDSNFRYAGAANLIVAPLWGPIGDPEIGLWNWQIGMVHLLQSRTDEAIVWLGKARRFNPRFRLPHAYLASAYTLKGEMRRAADELAEARRVNADNRY
jgi:hypothetical protein